MYLKNFLRTQHDHNKIAPCGMIKVFELNWICPFPKQTTVRRACCIWLLFTHLSWLKQPAWACGHSSHPQVLPDCPVPRYKSNCPRAAIPIPSQFFSCAHFPQWRSLQEDKVGPPIEECLHGYVVVHTWPLLGVMNTCLMCILCSFEWCNFSQTVVCIAYLCLQKSERFFLLTSHQHYWI